MCSLALTLSVLPVRCMAADHGATEPVASTTFASMGDFRILSAAASFTAARAWRLATALNLALLEPIDPMSAPFTWPTPPVSRTPFGLATYQAPPGRLWTKWRKVKAQVRAEAPALARCRTERSNCSPAAARFVAIIEQAAALKGRARLEFVNKRVNDAIRYTPDRTQWHRADVWSAPLDTANNGSFDTGRGDCEDYAIAKYVTLRNAGIPADDLQLLVLRDKSTRTYHAALAAREDGQWLILDNRWSHLIEDRHAHFFTPLFALDERGVQRFAKALPAPRHIEPTAWPVHEVTSTSRADTIAGFAHRSFAGVQTFARTAIRRS